MNHKYIVIQDNEDYTVSYLSENTDIEDAEIEDIIIEDSQYVHILDPNNEEDHNFLMNEINQKFKFLKETLQIGTINQGDKVVLEYPFEGDPSVIEKVKPSCGCTADVKIDGEAKVIRAIYDSKNDTDGISKTINVYFRDNLQLEIINTLGAKVTNPKKMRAQLKFYGKVIADPKRKVIKAVKAKTK